MTLFSSLFTSPAPTPLPLNPNTVTISGLKLDKDLEDKLPKDIEFKYLYIPCLNKWYVLNKNKYLVYLLIS